MNDRLKEYIEVSVGNYAISFDNNVYTLKKVKSDGIVKVSKSGKLFLVIKTEVMLGELISKFYTNSKDMEYEITSTKMIYKLLPNNETKTEMMSQMYGKLSSVKTMYNHNNGVSECVITFELRELVQL